jgi:hypothetical protein
MAEDGDQIMDARVRVPEHVVYRDFGDETVILNLRTGAYHGLNETAAAMVVVLGESPTVASAIDRLSDEYGVERGTVERDVLELCHALEERDLIERDVPTG